MRHHAASPIMADRAQFIGAFNELLRAQVLLPEVPTFRERGYPAIVDETWFAVFAPAGTPKPVLDKLSAALRKITCASSASTSATSG